MKPNSKDSSWEMNLPAISASPKNTSYDVAIIGGATMGACTAWFLASNPDFSGKVLVVEPRPDLLQGADRGVKQLHASAVRQPDQRQDWPVRG